MPDTHSDGRASPAIRGADVHGDGDALDLVADEPTSSVCTPTG
jgi:hypothetical protein